MVANAACFILFIVVSSAKHIHYLLCVFVEWVRLEILQMEAHSSSRNEGFGKQET